MKKRIALLYGGASSEHEVSLMGYEYVSRLLFDTEYEILPVYISRAGEWYITAHEVKIHASLSAKDGGSLYTDYGFIKIDAAIPLIHGEGGEDGTLQGALDTVGVRYIGADTVASAVCIDKVYTQGDGGGQAVNVYLDGKQITATVEKRQRERGASIMGNQVYNYG